MNSYKVELTDAEVKAMLTDMADIQEWIENFTHHKAGVCIDRICTTALEDATHSILTAEEKQLVVLELTHREIWLTSPKQLPPDIKEQIIQAARVKTALEVAAELEKGTL